MTVTAIVHHFIDKLLKHFPLDSYSEYIIIVMKISMIATVALLSLLAVASSAPHGRRYYQLLIDALEQQDDLGIIMYIILPIGMHY